LKHLFKHLRKDKLTEENMTNSEKKYIEKWKKKIEKKAFQKEENQHKVVKKKLLKI
tara:strand:- start:2701 stop:2868 length:168 start_codon:yes stop_codon:yes gene_type:complete